jgi:hypothetical protein
MDELTPIPHTQPSKVHMWILILLGWTAVFSLLSVGLLLTKNTDPGLSTTELSAACQNGVLNGITTNLTRISEACSASEPDPAAMSYDVTVKGTEYYPGFIAPAGWHVSGTMNADTYSISMGDRPLIVYYFDSDAPSETKIQMVSIPTPNTVTPDTQAAYVATLFPADGFENVTTTSQTLTNGTLYTTEADQLYEMGSDVHQTALHYFSSAKLVTIIYNNTADEDDWTMIKESIDWSAIK